MFIISSRTKELFLLTFRMTRSLYGIHPELDVFSTTSKPEKNATNPEYRKEQSPFRRVRWSRRLNRTKNKPTFQTTPKCLSVFSLSLSSVSVYTVLQGKLAFLELSVFPSRSPFHTYAINDLSFSVSFRILFKLSVSVNKKKERVVQLYVDCKLVSRLTSCQ